MTPGARACQATSSRPRGAVTGRFPAPLHDPLPGQVLVLHHLGPEPAGSELGDHLLGTQAVLDGRSLGPTPKAHISVKPGTHSVKFVNSDQGLTKTISVTVGAGETKPAVARLN